MTTATVHGGPAWLVSSDELPHAADAGAPPTWSENYLAYVWASAAKVGLYVHAARRVAPFELWDHQLNIALPGDRFVTAKAFGPARAAHEGLAIGGLDLRCEEPYRRWTMRYDGGGRVVDGTTYRSSPVVDAEHTPLRWELEFDALGPPFDFGTDHLDQAWGHGHYEQHGRLRGRLTVGEESFTLEGTGLRDHSWGPRDYRDIGTTTWLHAQFPKSGRSLMAVLVTGVPPRPPFSVAAIGKGDAIRHVAPRDLPAAASLADAEADFTFALDDAGDATEVSVTVVKALRAGLAGPAEIVLGTHDASTAHHHYIDAFARFTWDGEVGYGLVERSVDLTQR